MLHTQGVWPSFSRDGSRIVFSLDGSLVIIPSCAESAQPVRITPDGINATRPTWSWSPETIAFTCDATTIYTIESDGSNCRPFLPELPQKMPKLFHPCWYKDLKAIAVVGIGESEGVREPVIYKLTPSNSIAAPLLALTRFPDVCAGRLSVSPDCKTVVFAGNAGRCNQESNQLWVVTEGEAAERLEPGEPIAAYQGRSPGWSPDGRWIAFVSTRPAPQPAKDTPKAIWVISSSGGEPYQLTDSRYNPSNVEWSRDQKRIVFGSFTHGIGILDVPEMFLPTDRLATYD